MKHREETQQRYLNVINKYIENDNAYDLVKYAFFNGELSLRTFGQWLDFAKENCSDEVFKRVVEKAMPFLSEDGTDNEELMKKVYRVANDVFQKKAGLIEIATEVTPNMNKFVYMCKQMKFFYKEIPLYVYNAVVEYQKKVSGYDNPKAVFTARLDNLSEKENQMILDLIQDKGLLLNNVTYYEAYKYLVKKDVLKKPGPSR